LLFAGGSGGDIFFLSHVWNVLKLRVLAHQGVREKWVFRQREPEF
jgi:hypothetical protein